MVILDTETTDLTAPEAAPLDHQPYLVEFAAIKLDDKTLKETARMEFLCRPPVAIPLESIKITGITNEMVAGKPPFVAYLPSLTDFFLGERTVIAHNLAFDTNILRYELTRLGKVCNFPWPPQAICTVERTVHIKGYRLNLGDLHKMLIGKEHDDKKAHRAMFDVEALVRVVVALRKKGVL